MWLLKDTVLACLITVVTAFAAQAEIKMVSPENEQNTEKAEVAKIFYIGDMNEKLASEFITAIDDVNVNYKDLKRIYVYISSYGGDIDSGRMVFWAVKSSKIPITTVNMSMVSSSASMMFCGAQERMALPGANFILHPAAVKTYDEYVQPDAIHNTQQCLNMYNKMLSETYKTCSSLSDKEINSLLYSENQRLLISSEQAKEKGFVTKIAQGIVDAPVVYYITKAGDG